VTKWHSIRTGKYVSEYYAKRHPKFVVKDTGRVARGRHVKTALATEEHDIKIVILRLIELRIAILRWRETA
jgi:hypothetical protein